MWYISSGWGCNQKTLCSSEINTLNLSEGDEQQRSRSLRLPGIFVVQDTGPGPHIVLLLKVHFLPDVQAAKSTVTIQFSTFFDCSATPEPKPHTSADKRLHTPRKVGAKSSLHSISLTLAWLPVRHFNLISFPKLEAVLIVKESRTSECYPHMYTHTQAHRHMKAYSSSCRGKVSDRPKLQGPGASHPHKGQQTEEFARHLHQTGPSLIMSSIRDGMTGRYSINGHWNAAQGLRAPCHLCHLRQATGPTHQCTWKMHDGRGSDKHTQPLYESRRMFRPHSSCTAAELIFYLWENL